MGFVPTVSVGWFDAYLSPPQITIGHVSTTPRNAVVDSRVRRYDAVLVVDLWSDVEEERWKMVTQVDAIIQKFRSNPGTGLSYQSVSGWRDLDEANITPKIYRSRIEVDLTYYLTSQS
jgi:hypothetical protein